MIAIGEAFANEPEPGEGENHCFACSQTNPQGLRMRFMRTGEHSVESRYVVPRHFCGFEQVVHGGVQAALLDEVMSCTLNIAREPDDHITAATVELNLRYRRPVPIDEDIVIRGTLVKEDDRDVYLEGEILDAGGQTLTTATGRWRKLASEAAFAGRPNNA